MKSANWKDVAELIGISAIVASLVFVGLQMKQAQEIALSEARISILINAIESHSSINEHAGIWAKGNAGSELDDMESVIYSNLVKIEDDRVFLSSRNFQRLNLPAGEILIHDFAIFLYQNPSARRE